MYLCVLLFFFLTDFIAVWKSQRLCRLFGEDTLCWEIRAFIFADFQIRNQNVVLFDLRFLFRNIVISSNVWRFYCIGRHFQLANGCSFDLMRYLERIRLVYCVN